MVRSPVFIFSNTFPGMSLNISVRGTLGTLAVLALGLWIQISWINQDTIDIPKRSLDRRSPVQVNTWIEMCNQTIQSVFDVDWQYGPIDIGTGIIISRDDGWKV